MAVISLGIDLGSISAKIAILRDGLIERTLYSRHLGRPTEALALLLGEVDGWQEMPTAFTGSASRLAASTAGVEPVNEVVALAAAITRFHPEFHSVIEMGGQDSKLLLFRSSGRHSLFDDFAMNSICAAGTGSFLDQQAARLELDPCELGELALRCQRPPRVAGRCSVFAKSDMIHLQQVGTPPEDILAGLCLAVARNFKSAIAGGKEFRPPVGFVGGVAANEGMVRAFAEVLAGSGTGIRVPPHFHSLVAAGAALAAGEDQLALPGRAFLERVGEIACGTGKGRTCSPLSSFASEGASFQVSECPDGEPVYMGIDVGSISTNVVALDRAGRVVAREYLQTSGRPLEAVKRGLAQVGDRLGRDRTVLAVGTTGSGRYLTASFVGADIIRNEITAQARAAFAADPGVDTVFEIGGQDSKYISIDDGRVVDFEMNKVCAAGTGSFLEEQAERLGLDIRDFGPVGLEAPAPTALGERCTVFMESDVVSHQAAGTSVDNIVGGLCYSIVQNYIHRVVAERRIGRRILFQGGTAHNSGVVAAFRSVLGRAVLVPPHHDVTGAIGAALLASEELPLGPSTFRGFSLAESSYSSSAFTCSGCSNSCEIHQVLFEDGRKAFSGGRCEKYEEASSRPHGLDGFEIREELLLAGWSPPGKDSPRRKLGMPRALWFWELFPFFRTFFEELGFDVVLSSPSSTDTVHRGVENVAAETCFPVKLMHGHVLDLIENRSPDYIFLPSIQKAFPHKGFAESQSCPYVAGSPYVLDAGLSLSRKGLKILSPVLDLAAGGRAWIPLMKRLAAELGAPGRLAARACRRAVEVQEEFEASLLRAGAKMLDSLGKSGRGMVVVSRPYNGCDPSASGGLSHRLSRLGVTIIPAEFLDLPMERASKLLPNMYWHYGQKILAAALAIREDPRLSAVYLTNFGCGPDSFIHHFFGEIMGGKPFLTIETDEHAADAGMVTRCEAFLDSLRGSPGLPSRDLPEFFRKTEGSLEGRTVWVPNMGDGTRLIAAAARARGIQARPMPQTDAEAVSIGRSVTSGKECYPAIITSGNMLKVLRDNDPSKTAFFMGTASGPCRFGQYCTLHRLLLDRQGYGDVPVVTSSSKDSYTSVPGLSGPAFQLDLLKSAICSDLMRRALCRTRPYTARPADAEEIHEGSMAELERAVEVRGSVLPALARAAREFTGLLGNPARRPKILVFGEIYVRNDPYSNSWTADRIEDLGGEVMPTSILEWFEFVNACYVKKSLRGLKAGSAIGGLLKGSLMEMMKRRLEAPFSGLLDGREEPSPGEILNAAFPYMKENTGGEAILCIGAPVALAKRGSIDGAVNVLPFTCLPGTIVTAISKRLRRDYPDLPWLNLAFDGQEDTNNDARLEAFMFQVRERFDVDRRVPGERRRFLNGLGRAGHGVAAGVPASDRRFQDE
jgi:predicted CoA-substrate-specific enzyme activase